jgi:hypothetical protein
VSRATVQQRLGLARVVGALRARYPDAVAHADNCRVIAPRLVADVVHFICTGAVLQPIFVASPGHRTLVVPRTQGGGVDYKTVPMDEEASANDVTFNQTETER